MAGDIDAKKRVALALLELLGSKDLDKISITEITELAGVSRVTYYGSLQFLVGFIGIRST